jgi:hypothetical protein
VSGCKRAKDFRRDTPETPRSHAVEDWQAILTPDALENATGAANWAILLIISRSVAFTDLQEISRQIQALPQVCHSMCG